MRKHLNQIGIPNLEVTNLEETTQLPSNYQVGITKAAAHPNQYNIHSQFIHHPKTHQIGTQSAH